MSNLCRTQYRQFITMILMLAMLSAQCSHVLRLLGMELNENVFGLVPTTIWRPGSSLMVSTFHSSQLRLIFKYVVLFETISAESTVCFVSVDDF